MASCAFSLAQALPSSRRVSLRPAEPHVALPAHLRKSSTLRVRAATETPSEEKKESIPSPITNEGFGLGRGNAWFGFGPRQELNVGRLAMMGFAAGVVMEVLTGKGILAQLGIDPVAIRGPFLVGFAFLFVAGLLGGYVVINNPPDLTKAPPNAGAGIPRDPLKTYDPSTADPLTMFSRGGIVTRPDGQKGREPYVSDITPPEK